MFQVDYTHRVLLILDLRCAGRDLGRVTGDVGVEVAGVVNVQNNVSHAALAGRRSFCGGEWADGNTITQ